MSDRLALEVSVLFLFGLAVVVLLFLRLLQGVQLGPADQRRRQRRLELVLQVVDLPLEGLRLALGPLQQQLAAGQLRVLLPGGALQLLEAGPQLLHPGGGGRQRLRWSTFPWRASASLWAPSNSSWQRASSASFSPAALSSSWRRDRSSSTLELPELVLEVGDGQVTGPELLLETVSLLAAAGEFLFGGGRIVPGLLELLEKLRNPGTFLPFYRFCSYLVGEIGDGGEKRRK
ncbi:hypothetical protein CRUP_019819 [Coryphaenoides rupestris]|nr:hypothetical protein CRUP_019819 [Coryphaenoides rupestris]